MGVSGVKILGIVLVAVAAILLLLYFFVPDCRYHIVAVCGILSLLGGGASLYSANVPPAQPDMDDKQIENTDQPTQPQGVWLSDLEPAADADPAFQSYETVTDNLGNTYDNGIGGKYSYRENVQAYEIAGAYQSFSGKVVLAFDSRSTETEDAYVKIYGDDIPLWISPLITAGQEPVEIPQDACKLAGVQTLKISIYGESEIRLVDCALYPEAGMPVLSTCQVYDPEWTDVVLLKDLNTYYASGRKTEAFQKKDAFQDNLGNQYTNALIGTNYYGESWEVYNINGAFAQIQGRIALNYDERSTHNETYVQIYGDGQAIYQSKLFTAGTEPEDFKQDITHVKQLKIVIYGTDIALTDAALYRLADDAALSSAIKTDAAEEKTQVPLTMLDYVASSNRNGSAFVVYGIVKDNLGNVYADGIGGSDYWNENWQTYKLAKQYKRIEGQIVVDYDARSRDDADIYVKFYNGDTAFYMSPQITAGVEPISFSEDISSVDTLKISIHSSRTARLVNTYLYK